MSCEIKLEPDQEIQVIYSSLNDRIPSEPQLPPIQPTRIGHFIRKILGHNQGLLAEIKKKELSEKTFLDEINFMKQKLDFYESFINDNRMNQQSFSIDSNKLNTNQNSYIPIVNLFI